MLLRLEDFPSSRSVLLDQGESRTLSYGLWCSESRRASPGKWPDDDCGLGVWLLVEENPVCERGSIARCCRLYLLRTAIHQVRAFYLFIYIFFLFPNILCGILNRYEAVLLNHFCSSNNSVIHYTWLFILYRYTVYIMLYSVQYVLFVYNGSRELFTIEDRETEHWVIYYDTYKTNKSAIICCWKKHHPVIVQ